jgi:flagellar M-ring protein FliF
MQERLQKFFSNISTNVSDKWNKLEKPQKIRFFAALGVLIICIGLTLFLTLKPKYEVLVANEDITTISQVKTALDEAGIKNKVFEGGRSIKVRDKDVFEAQIAVRVHTDASTAIEPEEAFTTQDLFANSGIGVSEGVKKEMSRVALQDRLAAIIRRMQGIADAMIVLNIPETNGLFIKDNQVTTASVFITESEKTTKEQAQAIANTVAAGVKGLTLDNIVITNQYKEVVFPVADESEEEKLATEYEREMQRRREMQYDILTLLSPMFDDVKVHINLKLDNNKIKEEETRYTPYTDDASTGVLAYSQKNTESASGSGNAGEEPGLYANDSVAESYQTQAESGSDFSASKKSNTDEYKVNERKTITEKSVGDVILNESSASITAFNYKTIREEQMRANGLLNDISWYEYKQNTTPKRLDIDEELVEALRVGTGLENLTIVGYEVYTFVDEVKVPVDWQQIIIYVILVILVLMLAYGLIKRNRQDIEEVIVAAKEAEPELAVEDLLVSTQLEEAKEVEAEKLKDIDYTLESEVKKQIDKFVDEKPDAVAQLLRNWLQEGWE